MKVSDLEGEALDLWVSRALGYKFVTTAQEIGEATLSVDPVVFRSKSGWLGVAGLNLQGRWAPSTDWAMGGPIIDRVQIKFDALANDRWGAWIGDSPCDDPNMPTGIGATHLTAAMRAFVASKVGKDLPDSAEDAPQTAG